MSTRPLSTLAVLFAALAFVVLAACSKSISAGNDVPVVVEGPSITGIDAGIIPPPDAGMCNAYECPAPYATCPGTSGLCTTNLSNDVEHCGACDIVCPNSLMIRRQLHASFVCAKSQCKMLCADSFADCNGFVDDGCETNVGSDRENCGACGTKCAAGQICWNGACGCPPGYTQCGDQCVKTTEDDTNCGACGNVCGPPGPGAPAGAWPCGVDVYPPNAAFNCASSSCGMHCAPGFGDCNQDVCADGCETSLLDDAMNCGACGNACAPGQICHLGKCLCDPGKTRCGTSCVDLQNDVDNCGACGNACPGASAPLTAHGAPVCVLGRCGYACTPGYADCDHRIDNGCEVDLMVDPRHCGSCGTQCDLKGGQPCAGGQCLTKPCDPGQVR
jgi:hypothetical protein